MKVTWARNQEELSSKDLNRVSKGHFFHWKRLYLLKREDVGDRGLVQLNLFQRLFRLLFKCFGRKKERFLEKRLKIKQIRIISPASKVPFEKILKVQEKLSPKTPLFRPNSVLPNSPIPFMTMEGVSIIADEISKKNGFDQMFVCNSLNAVSKKLEEVKNMEEGRLALVVPAHQPEVTCKKKKGCRDKKHQVPDYHNQHKVSVLIEKKSGKTKICVMESQGSSFLRMEHTHLDKGEIFRPVELVHAYLREAQLENTTYYHTIGIRQFSDGGCSTFALRDCACFLKDPSFFHRIKTHGMLRNGTGTIDSPMYIFNLPPDFMKTSQSFKYLKLYKSWNCEGGYDLEAKLGRRKRSLKETIKRHKAIDPKTNKKINTLIDARTLKYQNFLLKFLKENSDKKISEKINRRFLVG